MKKIMFFTAIISFAFLTSAQGAVSLNCHTDAYQVDPETFKNFDMSFQLEKKVIQSLNSALVAKEGGKLYTNTFPPHPVEPNPFLRIKTEDIIVKDSFIGDDGEIIIYFSAGESHYVLDVEKEGKDKYLGTLKINSAKRVTIESRCYKFESF